MDYVFRLADGRRVVLWSERNQIIRQLSGGGGNRSHLSLRTDFLSDLSAASVEGKIYYVYQNTSRRVMLSLPDGEEDRMLLAESIEHCRHGGLTLTEDGGQLYLFYTAWSPIREKYSLNVCKPLSWVEEGEVSFGGEIPTIALVRDEEAIPIFQVINGSMGLQVIVGHRCFCLNRGEDGEDSWREGMWCDSDLAEEMKTRLDAAVTQYNELAEVARQLQIEGKKWRDKYYQETKKRRVRPPGAE